MHFRSLSPEDVISGGTRIVRARWEGGKIVVANRRPGLEKSTNLTVQVSIHCYIPKCYDYSC